MPSKRDSVRKKIFLFSPELAVRWRRQMRKPIITTVTGLEERQRGNASRMRGPRSWILKKWEFSEWIGEPAWTREGTWLIPGAAGSLGWMECGVWAWAGDVDRGSYLPCMWHRMHYSERPSRKASLPRGGSASAFERRTRCPEVPQPMAEEGGGTRSQAFPPHVGLL